MQAGQLNRRITIQQQSASVDSYGSPVQTWNTVYCCWASLAVQNSQLIYATSEFVSKATHRITLRWTSSVILQPNMRVVYVEQATNVTHTYNIEAVLNTNQRNREVVILCYELNGSE